MTDPTVPSKAYLQLRERLIAAATDDPRIVGLIDYGSTAEGRGDRWSDLDAAVWLRDQDFEAFEAGWRSWASGLGDLLLAYVGAIGHPWVVYRADPLPLRADFALHRASDLDRIATWPSAPISVEAAVWYDATGGALSERITALVGNDLGPPDLERAFERSSGDLWYYALRVRTKLLRGELWAARWEFNTVILDNLMWLLRIEAGAVERWRASIAATGLERAISSARLRRLDRCIPGPARAGLERAQTHAWELGRELCATLAAANGWGWPEALADRVEALSDR
jgi:lincosamide nucleotidyltransferase